jgi:hypothetical protein
MSALGNYMRAVFAQTAAQTMLDRIVAQHAENRRERDRAKASPQRHDTLADSDGDDGA